MKKLDRYVLYNFLGPFVVSFGIAIFVLVMQFLWLYIDEIAGKGVNLVLLMELIAYKSVTVFPLALPIAVLIATVMAMGNMAERHELPSMQSAGLSLPRIMYSLIVAAAGIAAFSYLCSNYLIPAANLQFSSRLIDIRRQKPALTLEQGFFNDDFKQFVIRIGHKAKDGERIADIMIEDQTNPGHSAFNQILADSGQMFSTAERRFFVMHLFKGTQYQQPRQQLKGKRYPFIRTNFQSWTKVWDMKEFELVRGEEGRLLGQHSVMSMADLRIRMDSLGSMVNSGGQLALDNMLEGVKRSQRIGKPIPTRNDGANAEQATQSPGAIHALVLPKQTLEKPLNQYPSLAETFLPRDRHNLLKHARTQAGTAKSIVESRIAQTNSRRLAWVKSGFELYLKYSYAAVCFVFLFIGAPMGAIIRKGGFGYPILVSISFFVTFVFLTILCQKLAEAFVLPPFWAAMMPCLLLVPVAAVLVRKATKS
jgi:lipopolysaccharide export system permease protein